jgi:hypothetical protein
MKNVVVAMVVIDGTVRAFDVLTVTVVILITSVVSVPVVTSSTGVLTLDVCRDSLV